MVTSPINQSAVRAADIPLDRLASNTALSQAEKIKEVSRQFEAVLLHQILAQAQKPICNGSAMPGGGAGSAIYQDMVTQQLADRVSRGGTFGFAKVLEKQLSHEFIHKKQEVSPKAVLAEEGKQL
jgi:Rod binding domain-containing protein